MPNSLLPRSRRARAAALLLALPLLAGCSAATTSAHPKVSSSGSSSSGSGSFVEKQPCDYLTAAQASAAIGETVTSSEKGGACLYDGAGLVSFVTTVTGVSGGDSAFWKAQVKSLADEDGKAIPIDGVGDAAYGGRSSFEESVIVRAGDAEIQIANADAASKNFTKSIAVAKAIIANLGS